MKSRVLVLLVSLFAAAGAFFFATSATASADLAPLVGNGDALAQLDANGITWSASGGCTDQGNPTCTSFEGVQQSTLDGIITLKNASGCAINITGGTEVGHAGGQYSHPAGYKLDISHNGCIDGYITGTFSRIGNRFDPPPAPSGGYPQYEAGSGNLYCDEYDKGHWDITFFTCGC